MIITAMTTPLDNKACSAVPVHGKMDDVFAML